MNRQETIMLVLTGCKTYFELHDRIRTTFDFPDCYGKNWDALFDFMSTEVAANHVIIQGAYTVPACLKQAIEQMLDVFETVKADRLQTFNEFFTYEVLN